VAEHTLNGAEKRKLAFSFQNGLGKGGGSNRRRNDLAGKETLVRTELNNPVEEAWRS